MQIYRIHNKKNNKDYIGATKWTFNERYSQGKWWKWTHSVMLKRALERYGLEALELEILHESAKTEEELFELEKLYIKQYDCIVPKGYNLTIGGGKENPSLVKEYELIDRSGSLHKIINLSEFSRKNGLNYGGMLNMVCGIHKSSQGYTLSSNPLEYIIKDPEEEWELQEIKNNQSLNLKRKEVDKFCNI